MSLSLEMIVARPPASRALLAPLFHEQIYRFARPEVDGMHLTYARPVVPYEELALDD